MLLSPCGQSFSCATELSSLDDHCPPEAAYGSVEGNEALKASAEGGGSAHQGRETWEKKGSVGRGLGWTQAGWPCAHPRCPW